MAEGKRCDGRCHNASSAPDRCACWCEGAYHGCGELEACQRMVRDLGGAALRRRRLRHDPDDELGPLFTYQHEARVLEHARRIFANAAAILRAAGLMR